MMVQTASAPLARAESLIFSMNNCTSMNHISQPICSMLPSSSLFLEVLFGLKYPISSGLNDNPPPVPGGPEGPSGPGRPGSAGHDSRAICIVSLIISCNWANCCVENAILSFSLWVEEGGSDSRSLDELPPLKPPRLFHP